ncbi:right-handed parallel beta-helix repeat-containing protein [Haladaptatus sp. NG-WS-4]
MYRHRISGNLRPHRGHRKQQYDRLYQHSVERRRAGRQGHTVDAEHDYVDGYRHARRRTDELTVKNVVVTDWQNGITLETDDNRLENVTVTDNAVGVVLRGTDDTVLANSTVSNNRRHSPDGSGSVSVSSSTPCTTKRTTSPRTSR